MMVVSTLTIAGLSGASTLKTYHTNDSSTGYKEVVAYNGGHNYLLCHQNIDINIVNAH